MRRVLLLVALVALLLWLINAEPRYVKGESRASWFYSRAAAPPSSPLPTWTCGECDPNDESACIQNGGSWDSSTCNCIYGCDPYAEQQCYESGGDWDSFTCTCTPWECNPGSPEPVGQVGVAYQYCDGWEIWDCEGTWTDYEQRCEDGSLYSSWTEYTEVCVGTGDSCGDQGCDPWECCDYWYCS
jgi:hypothetical protein